MATAVTTTISARVPESLGAALEAVSLITGRSGGSILREALEEWLRGHWSPEQLEGELADVRAKQEAAAVRVAQLANESLTELAGRA